MSQEEAKIRKGMIKDSNFQTNLSGHLLFDSSHKVQSSEESIKDVYEISVPSLAEFVLPNPHKQIHLLHTQEGYFPLSEVKAVASVRNLSSIGVQRVLDHEETAPNSMDMWFSGMFGSL